MKLIKVLSKGALKSALSFKFILLIWIAALVMILLVALPLKSGFNAIFDTSMITGKLTDGFDAGLITDMGPAFKQLMSSATSGGALLIIAGIILFTFFAGGLFTAYTTEYAGLNTSAFLKASAQHFLSFLGIGFFTALFIAGWTLLIISAPAGVVMIVTDDISAAGRSAKYLYIIWALGMPVWFLVADHSRRWIAATGSHGTIKALKEGFISLGADFLTSYFTMLIISIVNLLFIALILWFTAVSIPDKGLMVFLFFIATQLLFIMRLLLKGWRFAAVTELARQPGE